MSSETDEMELVQVAKGLRCEMYHGLKVREAAESAWSEREADVVQGTGNGFVLAGWGRLEE